MPLKLPKFYLFLDKHVLSKCIKYCFNMALCFKNFPGGGGGGKTKSATVRFFPGSALVTVLPTYCLTHFMQVIK